jgi:aminoglycoside phosphotransferase (APT) family kinase protein
MEKNLLDSLAEPQRDAAHAALRSVLGSTPIDDMAAVSGGATAASILRIDAGGRSYLLRIEGPASPLRNPHQYGSMRIAADAGIAPRLYHADEASRVAVIDFIVRRPLDAYPGGPAALARALGELFARLQGTTLFPHFVQYPDIVARLWAHVCRTGLFAPDVLDPCTERLAHISEAYRRHAPAPVSSHNDSIPANILFDGKRLWLVDWESAYRNDPLVDIAIVADNLARTPQLEGALLRAWLGRAPDDALLARLALVRALTRLYYAGVLLSASATFPRAAPDGNLDAPTSAELDVAVDTGRLKPGAPETKHALGKMFLASFMTGVATPGFAAAV